MNKSSELKQKSSNVSPDQIYDIIRSSYSNGLRLDYEKYRLPGENNLYGSFYKIISKESLARLFWANNWSIRKSTHEDFEVQSDYCEFIIEGNENKPLINGVIDTSMIDTLADTLKSMALSFTLEIYEGDQLSKTTCNKV